MDVPHSICLTLHLYDIEVEKFFVIVSAGCRSGLPTQNTDESRTEICDSQIPGKNFVPMLEIA